VTDLFQEFLPLGREAFPRLTFELKHALTGQMFAPYHVAFLPYTQGDKREGGKAPDRGVKKGKEEGARGGTGHETRPLA
jgi:hypothetical protein